MLLHSRSPVILLILFSLQALDAARVPVFDSKPQYQMCPGAAQRPRGKWAKALGLLKAQNTVRTVLIEGEKRWRLSTTLIDTVNRHLRNERHYYRLFAARLALKCVMPSSKAHFLFLTFFETKCDRLKTIGSGRQFDCTHFTGAQDLLCKVDRVKQNNSTKVTGIVCQPGGGWEPEVRRLPMVESYRRWDRPLAAYDPPHYSSDVNTGAETDICKKDQVGSVSREVVPTEDGVHIPLNPSGRTGLGGRGLLPCFGPNAIVIPMIIRSKNGKTEVLVDLEVWNNRTHFEFPQVFEPNAGRYPLGRKLTRAVKEMIKRNSGEAEANRVVKVLRASLQKKDNILHKGIVNDSINTDNAWLQLTAFVHKDKNESDIGALEFKAEESKLGVGWRNIDDAIVEPREMLLFSLLPPRVTKKLFRRRITATRPTAALRRLRKLFKSVNVTEYAEEDDLPNSEHQNKGKTGLLCFLG